MSNVTKQGVRDLNGNQGNGRKKESREEELNKILACSDERRHKFCDYPDVCKKCGYFND